MKVKKENHEENQEEDQENNKNKKKTKDKKLILLEKKKKFKENLKNNLKLTLMRPEYFHLPVRKNVDDFTSYLNLLGKRSEPSNIAKFDYFTALKFKED